MPESRASYDILSLLHRAQRTFRLATALRLLVAGAALAGAIAALGVLASWRPEDIRLVSLGCGALVWGAAAWNAARRVTLVGAAALLERRTPNFDNLLVTAEELLRNPGRLHPTLSREVFEQASRRAAAVHFRPRRELAGPATQAAACVAAVALLLVFAPTAVPRASEPAIADLTPASLSSTTLTVTVQPPAYTGEPSQTLHEPQQIRVREGSVVQLRIDGGAPPLELLSPGQPVRRFENDGQAQVLELEANASMFPLLRALDADVWAPRSLGILVQPDLRPSIRVTAPGRDLAFAAPSGRIQIELHAEDDLGLAAVGLRYTVVSGSGETFTFEERTLPLQVSRTSDRRWQARGELRLETLELESGDTIVYRAVANDSKPGAPPALSESYLVEIGSAAGAISAGFALPEERDRHALSQQMVIVKTERLLAAAASLTAQEVIEQGRLLAVEQRMVRAEFVFMTGGEVQDEEEEAAHSHELAEGRFENEGARELLAAIREMSRAEARLNDGAVADALPFERAALKALQRAFDRRRYFLKTLPERTRIDPSRRLSGDRSTAAPEGQTKTSQPRSDQADQLRAMLRVLADQNRWSGLLAEVGSRVGGLAPDDEAMQQAATGLAAAALVAPDQQREAVRASTVVLTARLREHLSPPPSQTLGQAGRRARTPPPAGIGMRGGSGSP